MTIKELAVATGKSLSSVYRLARILGRTPTLEEVKSLQQGRPSKYAPSDESKPSN